MKMDEDDIHGIRIAGLLHDIGLVTVPEEIINKRDHLSADEWRRIKEHPEVGETILRHIASLERFLPVVRHHHEHYDGAGYPDGLAKKKFRPVRASWPSPTLSGHDQQAAISPGADGRSGAGGIADELRGPSLIRKSWTRWYPCSGIFRKKHPSLVIGAD